MPDGASAGSSDCRLKEIETSQRLEVKRNHDLENALSYGSSLILKYFKCKAISPLFPYPIVLAVLTFKGILVVSF